MKKYQIAAMWAGIGLLLLLCSEQILRGIAGLTELFGTFLLGLVLAFVLDQPYGFFRRILARFCRPKTAHVLAILGAYLLVLALLAAVVGVVLPQLADSVRLFAGNVDAYLTDLQRELDTLTAQLGVRRIDLTRLTAMVNAGMGKIDTAVLPEILSVTGAMLRKLAAFAVGTAFSVYLLAGKERILSGCDRILRAYLPAQTYTQARYVLGVIASVFRGYIIGQSTEAVILGGLCFVGMLVLRLEYAGMVSVVVGVTALIPILGAYIGGLIAAVLLLVISPWKALTFLLFFVILQQIENNVIYPRVVGGRIGLPGIWVLLAITVGGQLGGVVGMLFGVPVTTIAYTLLRNSVQRRERTK